jgi:SAM-dependent methyltransferase
MQSNLYSTAFFSDLNTSSLPSACEVVPLITKLIQPLSVVDVGCGTGAWLHAFEEVGVRDILGLDGAYVDKRVLQIDSNNFRSCDVSRPITMDRTFDLAVSIEVAEHLPAESSRTLVDSLTTLAPAVVFSAAVPGQGGVGHINEQWPDYWAQLFIERGFVLVDCLRPVLWNNPRVAWYYRQNLFLYVKNDQISRFPESVQCSQNPPEWTLKVVHPGMYEGLLHATNPQQLKLREALKNFAIAAGSAVKRRLV